MDSKMLSKGHFTIIFILIWKLLHIRAQAIQCIENGKWVEHFTYDTTVYTNPSTTIWEYRYNASTARLPMMGKVNADPAISVSPYDNGRVEETCVNPKDCDTYNAGLILNNITGSDIGLYLLKVTQGALQLDMDMQIDNVTKYEDEAQIKNKIHEDAFIEMNGIRYTLKELAVNPVNLPSDTINLIVNVIGSACVPPVDVKIKISRGNVASPQVETRDDAVWPLKIVNAADVTKISLEVLTATYTIYSDPATTPGNPDTTTTQPIPTTDDKDPSPGPTQPPVTSDSLTEAPTTNAPRLSPPWWAWVVLALGLLLLLVLIVVGCMCCEGCPGYKRRQRKQMKRGVYIDERVPPQPHDQPYGQPHSQVAGQPQGYPQGYPSGQPHGYNHTQHSNGRGVSVHRDHRQDELSMQPRGQPSVVTMKTNDQRPTTATAYNNQGYTPEPAPDYGDGTARITVSGRY